jgi:hypothetical protein
MRKKFFDDFQAHREYFEIPALSGPSSGKAAVFDLIA